MRLHNGLSENGLDTDAVTMYTTRTRTVALIITLTTTLHKHHDNESYIYYNHADRKWWIDGLY